MKAILDAVVEAVDNEPQKSQIKGVSKDQIIGVVKAVTEGLDKMPPETSLHAVLFGLSYVRNAVIVAMEDNQKRMEKPEGTA